MSSDTDRVIGKRRRPTAVEIAIWAFAVIEAVGIGFLVWSVSSRAAIQ